jgi:hypothetical protein
MVAIIYSCVTWPVGRDGQESPDPPPRSERRAACGRHPFPLSTARVASRSFSGQGISIGKWPIRGHLIIWRSFSKNSGSPSSAIWFSSVRNSFSEVSDLRDYSGAMAVLRAPMDFVWMSLLQFDGYTFEPNFILCLTLGFFLSVPLDTRPTAGCSCSLLAKTCFGVAVGGTRVSHSTLGCSTGEQTTWSPGLHAERYCFVVRLFRYLYGRARSAVGSGVPVFPKLSIMSVSRGAAATHLPSGAHPPGTPAPRYGARDWRSFHF